MPEEYDFYDYRVELDNLLGSLKRIVDGIIIAKK